MVSTKLSWEVKLLLGYTSAHSPPRRRPEAVAHSAFEAHSQEEEEEEERRWAHPPCPLAALLERWVPAKRLPVPGLGSALETAQIFPEPPRKPRRS